VPGVASAGRVDGPGESQRRAGYRVAAGGLAAVARWSSTPCGAPAWTVA